MTTPRTPLRDWPRIAAILAYDQAHWLAHTITGWWFAAWTVIGVASAIDTGDPLTIPVALAIGAFIYFAVRAAARDVRGR
jgi:hypothetical protein